MLYPLSYGADLTVLTVASLARFKYGIALVALPPACLIVDQFEKTSTTKDTKVHEGQPQIEAFVN